MNKINCSPGLYLGGGGGGERKQFHFTTVPKCVDLPHSCTGQTEVINQKQNKTLLLYEED